MYVPNPVSSSAPLASRPHKMVRVGEPLLDRGRALASQAASVTSLSEKPKAKVRPCAYPRLSDDACLSSRTETHQPPLQGRHRPLFDQVALSGRVTFGQADELGADLYAIRGEAPSFVTDDFRLDGGSLFGIR